MPPARIGFPLALWVTLAALLLPALCLAAPTNSPPAESVPMRVKQVLLINDAPAVLLMDHKEQRYLMLWVDVFMATAIRMGLSGVTFDRPLTHDLIDALLRRTGARVKEVVITELKDTTYYAVIALEVNAHTETLDSRPSDALAIAVRSKAPIFARSDLLRPLTSLPELGPLPEEHPLPPPGLPLRT
ncbi:MAG: bifunctional nuclease family protein [Deltaproteobacteria bacterium]|nr:bifunctional nuclease family protein [Deltaproteobacteria bacterium]